MTLFAKIFPLPIVFLFVCSAALVSLHNGAEAQAENKELVARGQYIFALAGGCACHSGGLSVQTFLRGIHVVDYDRTALAEATRRVVALAEAEDLPAHGAALKARYDWGIPE